MKNEDFRKYYKNIRYLDEGRFGKVCEACLINNEEEKRAIKIMTKEKIKTELGKGKLKLPSDDEIKSYIHSFENEVNNMKMIEGLNRENKNTVKYYESYLTKDEFAIVMELCDQNLLKSYLRIIDLLMKRKSMIF